MKKTAALVCLGFLLAASALAQKPASPALRDRFLREDLALAKTSSLYLVIFLESRTMSLRAGGLTLRDIKITGLRSWGVAQPLEPLAIAKKSTLFPPKRTEIIPQTEEQAEQAQAEAEKSVENKKEGQKAQSFELEALELKDMPSSFAMFMSDGTRVYFRPKAQKFLPRLASFGHTLSWYLWVPLKELWFRLKKKPFPAIDLKLEAAEDCQSIYWSLAEGAKVLIFPL
jgi:hypothetical protein